MARMVLRRIDPISAGKISGAIYVIMGLIVGAIFSLISLLGVAAAGTRDAGMLGALFGVGAIVIFPLFYGVLGFIVTVISAAIYNLVAGWVGGVVVELD